VRLHGRELIGRDVSGHQHLRLEHPNAPFADGAHRELGLAGHPELAHDDHVERDAERTRHLGRDRNATSRESDDDDGVFVGGNDVPGHELGGERGARFGAVGEAIGGRGGCSKSRATGGHLLDSSTGCPP
jgi:hypothetical protein